VDSTEIAIGPFLAAFLAETKIHDEKDLTVAGMMEVCLALDPCPSTKEWLAGVRVHSQVLVTTGN
jgi:hypothetical protein